MPDITRSVVEIARLIVRLFSKQGSSGSGARRRSDGTARPGSGFYSPGRSGPDATIELSPSQLSKVRIEYSPSQDGTPDPGEVVWTWVPYQERDGRGKDRPVIIVAHQDGDKYLAVELTSKGHEHSSDPDYISLGAGPWDAQRRNSWAVIDRVFCVRVGGMRREAAALDSGRFELVANALRERYRWN